MMTVAVDGVDRYRWPVSTGNSSRETPNGSFRAFRLEETHFSKECDYSRCRTRFLHRSARIHGTDSEAGSARPRLMGCVRLVEANATTLYALVHEQGVLNTLSP